MTVNLRRALRLRSQIEQMLKSMTVEATVSIDIDDERLHLGGEITEGLTAALEADVLAAVEKHDRLSRILVNIRNLIAAANTANGVEAALAAVAAIDRRAQMLSRLVAGARNDNVSIERRIERKREELNNTNRPVYGRSSADTSITISALSEETRKGFETELVRLKQQKVATEDDRNAINARTTIEIAEDDLTFLEGLGIV